MKKIFSILCILLVVMSCQPDSIPEIGKATDFKPFLTGTWDLVRLVQIDADAEAKSFPGFATSKDLTNIFPDHPYTDFSITFNADGTFTTNVGSSYIQMLSDGNWALNNSTFPSAIVLSKGGVSQEIGLGSLAGVTLGEVEFKEVRKQAGTGKVKIKYVYSLKKADE